MAEERTQRHLAAILAADVVGYSRLIERDERETLQRFRTHRQELFEPEVSRHSGRIFKLTGDGFLAEFASVVDAVECAVALQREMAARNQAAADGRRMDVRLAINLGDVIVEGEDRLGEGVIIAARLETLADPGGILMSGSAFDQVRNKTRHRYEDLGVQTLKNIAEPVRVYRIVLHPELLAREKHDQPDGALLPLPAAPSLAVLPFASMSADRDQEYFADGLTEDLITDLSKVAGLFVIASHSSFAYKGRSLDVRGIARELGVRYLLEGSARRATGRVRINAQLIDAIGGGHLWAERFDRDADDIFAVQDEVTAKIVEALVGRLRAPAPLPRNRPTNLEAYDLCVRARQLMTESPLAAREARLLLEQSLALDPGFAEAHRWLAFNRMLA